MQQLSDYKVSAERGFLPLADPTRALPAAFSRWDEIGAVLPALLMGGRLRPVLEDLPPLDSAALTAEGDLNRAMLLLSVFASAYVWGGKEPAQSIPEGVARPFCEVAERLGLPPIVGHCHLALHNWQRLDPTQPVSIENIAPLQLFLGGLDEHWFYLLTVAIEAAGGPVIAALLAARDAARNEDIPALTAALADLEEALVTIYDLLARMPEQCDPYIFYHRIRPFVTGWPEPGMIYHGVSETPRIFMGGSAAQSPLIQAIDAGLGVRHEKEETRGYLRAMRDYMLPDHRRFLSDLEAESRVRAVVTGRAADSPELVAAYNRCLKRLDAFRARHMEFSVNYILHQAADREHAKGTGGTDFVSFLSQSRKETQSGMLS